MLVAVTAVLSFTQPLRIGFNAHGTVTRRAIDVRAVAQDADLKAIDAAASKVRRAAAMFGPEQKTAANSWLDKTIDNGGFSSAALLKQKKLLFEECVIDDDGSSNCLALDDALVDLQTAMTNLAGDKATNTQKLLAQNKVNKAKLAVRAVAAKFGKTQKNQADAWLEQALGGQSADSLFEGVPRPAISHEVAPPGLLVVRSKLRPHMRLPPSSYAQPRWSSLASASSPRRAPRSLSAASRCRRRSRRCAWHWAT